jgi:hypothetical protein
VVQLDMRLGEAAKLALLTLFPSTPDLPARHSGGRGRRRVLPQLSAAWSVALRAAFDGIEPFKL